MKPIRVALSGSGFKFPAHVGALLAIRDLGYAPVEYAGTSGGSIVSALAAYGMDLNTLKSLVLNQDWSSMLTFNPLSLIGNLGYCSGNTLLSWITEQTQSKTFRELPVGLTIMASDVYAESPFEFSQLLTPDIPIAIAARSSASIPFVFSPMQLGSSWKDSVLLMDGGMVNNIPADKLIPDDIPRIGIQLTSKTIPLGVGEKSFASVLPRVVDMMLSSNENTHVDLDKMKGVKFSFVETGYASGLDRNMSLALRQRLLSDGYNATKQVLSLM